MLGSQIRLVALDLDGTLLDSQHRIPPANVLALETLKRHAVRIALVTGRRFCNAARIVQQYGLGDLIIIHNGALIRNCDSGEVLYFQELGRQVCRDVINAARPLRHSPFVLVDPRETRVLFERQPEEHRARSEYLTRNRTDSVQVTDLTLAIDTAPVIQLMFTHAIAPLEECKRRLTEQFGRRVTILETIYPERDHTFLDVIHAGCSKGKALDWLMRRENLSPHQVMAFGDNHNDLEMLQVAGHSFLMDNATEELKRLGFRNAPRNDAAGVAHIVNQYWR
ncbi:MAG: HAD family phosphatase [Acidobacteria bacterium]|nr:HAD family phosphatase [Acidobacteriota bacterium]